MTTCFGECGNETTAKKGYCKNCSSKKKSLIEKLIAKGMKKRRVNKFSLKGLIEHYEKRRYD